MRDIAGRVIVFSDLIFRRKMVGKTKSTLLAIADGKQLPAGEVIHGVKNFVNI
jgi:hypothetical protein